MALLGRQAGRGAGVFLVILLVALVLGAVGGVLWGRLGKGHGGKTEPAQGRASATKPSKAGPEKLVLSEARLTEMLRQAAGENAADGKVTLESGLIVVTGTLKRGPIGVPTQAVIEPFVESGSIAVVVREAKAGGISLPREASMALAGRIKQMLYQEQQKIKGLVVDTVEVKNKELVLTGHFEAGKAGG